MPALIETGISNQQLLAVWSTNADTGFTIDQLLAARITLSQMYAGGIPGYILFNEVCNTSLSVGTGSAPKIKLLSTNLVATNTRVVLEARGSGSVRCLYQVLMVLLVSMMLILLIRRKHWEVQQLF